MNKMIIEGIETHNLKNLNISIPFNKTTVIYGRSGAGKSSLAFSSIYQLCKDEFDAVENGYLNESDYKVAHYSGLIPAVAMPQRNTNNNPRSTIYSYLNIAQALSSLKIKNNFPVPSYDKLKLSNYKNECLHCFGLGETTVVDEDELIIRNCRLDQNPFSCWRGGDLSDYYHQLLMAYCERNDINIENTFDCIPQDKKDLILYGQSSEKLSFRFKHKGKTKQRRAFYKGVMNYANANIGRSQANSKYKKERICLICNGSRVNRETGELDIIGFTFDDFLLSPISDLCETLEKSISNSTLFRVLSSINKMGLGYLNLSRSIPSLSGGEIQKLIFSRLLTSNTTGILIVIDEISSQINPVDFDTIHEKITKLSQNNTIILVEHTQYFIDKADQKIHIGKFAGSFGGEICEQEVIQPEPNLNPKNNICEYYHFNGLNKNNVINQSVDIPKECVTIFSGISGSGKSSLAKSICYLMDSIYISQKLPSYTGRSTVATITDLNKLIAEYYSKHTNLDLGYFLPNKQGGCEICEGKGVLKYERGFEKDIYISCYKCEGKLFNLNSDEVNTPVHGMNIIDIYNTELKELSVFFDQPKIKNILKTINSLGISHLKLNRKTQTLSGGEMRRVKLCEVLSKSRKTNKILFIDEPVAGLDPETASKVLNFIYQKSQLFNAIVIIEHRPEAENYADFKISIGPLSGTQGGQVIEQRIIK